MNHIEDLHQKALIDWARTYRKGAQKLFAIPNGGKRNKGEASRLKAQGVTAGIPDLCLPLMRGGFGALYIELKAPKAAGKPAGKLSQAQSDKLAELTADGYKAVCCFGVTEAIKAIAEYLGET